jgi:hypothetical protein
MSSQTYLSNRNGIYYCRVPVPAEIQIRIGKKEVCKSLRTSSYRAACQQLRYKVEEIMDSLVMMDEKKITPDIIKLIAEEHYKVEMAADEQKRRNDGGKMRGAGALEAMHEGNRMQLEDMKQSLVDGNGKHFAYQANRKLDLLGITINQSSKYEQNLHKQLCFELLHATAKAYKN